MDKLAHPSSFFLDPDWNPILRKVIKSTVYAQFCAGENRLEVQNTVKQLRQLGYKGVVLAFARENDVDKNAAQNGAAEDLVETPEAIEEITAWSNGNRETVRLASQGDFVAIKYVESHEFSSSTDDNSRFTGAGNFALKVLAHNLPPTPSLKKAIDDICDLASARNVRLLFDAEHQLVQAAIDNWTLESMKKYNGRGKGATVYGTYQAYLKATPRILAEHMAAAKEAGFVLGIKLVRGAYLGSDPRNLINDTKEETDRQYDGIAASLMQCSFNNVLQCSSKTSDPATDYPDVNVVLASHNELSVRRAQEIRMAQAKQCQPRINLVYAQLMGMADEVSCELLKASRVCNAETAVDAPQAYKYLVWGTTGECMKYLLRRAQENRDAVGRTRVGRDLMVRELWRRMKSTIGMA